MERIRGVFFSWLTRSDCVLGFWFQRFSKVRQEIWGNFLHFPPPKKKQGDSIQPNPDFWGSEMEKKYNLHIFPTV